MQQDSAIPSNYPRFELNLNKITEQNDEDSSEARLLSVVKETDRDNSKESSVKDVQIKVSSMSNESTYDRLNKLAQDPSNFVSVTNCQSPENFEALESRTPNHQEINLDQVAEPKVQEASQFTLAKKKHKRKKSS